jgi:hypothetical protein
VLAILVKQGRSHSGGPAIESSPIIMLFSRQFGTRVTALTSVGHIPWHPSDTSGPPTPLHLLHKTLFCSASFDVLPEYSSSKDSCSTCWTSRPRRMLGDECPPKISPDGPKRRSKSRVAYSLSGYNPLKPFDLSTPAFNDGFVAY